MAKNIGAQNKPTEKKGGESALFSVKQQITLVMKIEDLGSAALGTRLIITGTPSGTEGLMTLSSRVTKVLGVLEAIAVPRGTTVADFKLFQPQGLGNPCPATTTFVASIKGGTSSIAARA
jgi:hypothetical protein